MHLVQLGRQHAIATGGGWALSPEQRSGNDNKDAHPEVLVCIRNLASVAGSATVRSIDWTDGAYADSATFDITLTFDEAIDFTSATATENQTVTNKAYILLNRLGATDMVEDNTIAAQYYSGSGTNQITFRGVLQSAVADISDLTQRQSYLMVLLMQTKKMENQFLQSDKRGELLHPADRIVLDSTAAVALLK